MIPGLAGEEESQTLVNCKTTIRDSMPPKVKVGMVCRRNSSGLVFRYTYSIPPHLISAAPLSLVTRHCLLRRERSDCMGVTFLKL